MWKYLLVLLIACSDKEHVVLTPYMALNICAESCKEDVQDVLAFNIWFYPLSETHEVKCTCGNYQTIRVGKINIQGGE